jgi:hypothetical protein
LNGKSKGRRPLGRYGRRWEENIRMDFKEIAWKVGDWIHVVQNTDQWRALVKKVMKYRVP